MGGQRRRELASATATRSATAKKVRILFASRAVHWLRRLLAHVTTIAHAKPTTEHAIITFADARVIRRTVLARRTIFERALLWRWCIGVVVVYAGPFTALLAILGLATHAWLQFQTSSHRVVRKCPVSGADQGDGATAVAMLRSPGEPGKASPIRGGGIRRREPGPAVAIFITALDWAVAPDLRLLVRAFDLTATEAKIQVGTG